MASLLCFFPLSFLVLFLPSVQALSLDLDPRGNLNMEDGYMGDDGRWG